MIALISQLISLGVGNGDADLLTLVIVLIFSSASYSALRLFFKAHKGTMDFGEETIDDLALVNQKTSSQMLVMTAIASFSAYSFLMLSSEVGEQAIPVVYGEVVNSGKSWLDLIASVLYQLVYAGSVLTIVSYFAFLRYQFYPITRKVRIWLSRCKFWIFSFVMFPEDNEFEALLEERCSMCWKADFEPIKDDRYQGVYCSFCGYQFNFSSKPTHTEHIEANRSFHEEAESNTTDSDIPHQN